MSSLNDIQSMTYMYMYVCSVLAREKIKQVCKSELQGIFVVLTHSCYHIKKENLPKERGFSNPLYCFGENRDKGNGVSLGMT